MSRFTRGHGGPGWQGQHLLATSPLDAVSGLPSWMTFTRGAGSWSTQTAAAVNGTTFVSTGTSQNTPRFHYLAAAGRRMLLVEPTRTTLVQYSDFVDAGPDNLPDNWTAWGAAGTDFTTQTGAPHGGRSFRIENTATVNRGAHTTCNTTGATHTWSALYRAISLAGATPTMYAFQRAAGFAIITVTTGTYDWTRQYLSDVGGGGSAYMLTFAGDGMTGQLQICMPQVEAGAYASTWIPDTIAGNISRAAELCTVAASRLNASAGSVSFLWCPLWANTEVTGTATLFAWAANDRIDFEGTGDTIRVVNNSVTRATSAALTFSRETLHRVRVDYGTFGTRLWVDGVLTTDTNAWVAPTIAAALGSTAADANKECNAFGDLVIGG